MKIEKLVTPLLVQKLNVEVQQPNFVKADYHQFLYILKGRGVYKIPEAKTGFSSGDLFLVRKEQEHSFSFDEESTVYSIKFNEKTRLKLKEISIKLKDIARQPIKAKSPLNLKVSFPEEELAVVNQLFDFVCCLGEDAAENENIIYFQLISLVSIIERNLKYSPDVNVRTFNKDAGQLIVKHIQRNLKNPEKLTLKYIATNFGMTVNKLGTYFKQETGQTVKQFVNTSRMTVIAEQIKSGDLSFSEIAFMYGFVDESHLNKTFKKYFGKTPSEFRKGV